MRQAEKSWFEPPRPKLRMKWPPSAPDSAVAPDIGHEADEVIHRGVTGIEIAVHGISCAGK
jgi:hypothetical protein